MHKTLISLQLAATIIIVEMLLVMFSRAEAQVSALTGANYCYVLNNHLIKNQKPIVAYQFGVAVRVYPFKNLQNLSIQNEMLLLNQKGYKQVTDQYYSFKFNYISLPILLCYSPVKDFSINGGVEVSKLLFTNQRRGLMTYNNTDVGIVMGVTCFDSQLISIYSRFTLGLVPMLDYYSFDKLGNFTGEIHDFNNRCLSIGIKLNFYNDKILLHK